MLAKVCNRAVSGPWRAAKKRGYAEAVLGDVQTYVAWIEYM